MSAVVQDPVTGVGARGAAWGRRLASRVSVSLRPALRCVRPTGWVVAVLGVLCLVIGRWGAWRELTTVGAMSVGILLLCAIFLLGRTQVEVALRVSPQRLSVGEPPVAGDMRTTNTGARPLLGAEMELPVGSATHRFRLPVLGKGAEHTETFLVPSTRRSVVPVGPVRTRRGDPLGLFSRTVERAGVQEIFIRPRSAPLEALGAGLMRDLEGMETPALSASDLAFHALREYVPGDDMRHVHWLSSAKSDQLMVRQYLDTRRSHITVVIDVNPASYPDSEEFELVCSVAASIVRRSVVDGFQVTVVHGLQVVSEQSASELLDALCRVAPIGDSLVEATLLASRTAPDTSLLFLLSGTGLEFAQAQRASVAFGPEVSRYAIRADCTSPAAVQETNGLPVLSLPSLDALPGLLRWVVR